MTAQYGTPRGPPGALKLLESEQRVGELTATAAELRRKLAREQDLSAAANRDAKARVIPAQANLK